MYRLMNHLRDTLLGDGASGTDAELLERFITSRDSAALELLVRRHAPMVWGVCRRVLSNLADAEDAFQATFLVLVRRAAAVVPRELVANWLYGVALQTARKSRSTAAKRSGRERQVTVMPERVVPTEEPCDELRPALDHELARLPDKYRTVIVLSDLAGQTRSEVARELGLPEGTVASRLARGRAILAERLSGRGVALSGAAVTLLLQQQVASARVPPTVQAITLAAVSELAAGGTAATNAAALAEKVVRAIRSPNHARLAAGILGVGLLIGAVGISVASPRHGSPATSPSAPERQAGATASELESVRGRWKAVRVAVRGDAVDLGEDGPEYTFTKEQLAVSYAGRLKDAGSTPGWPPAGLGGTGGFIPLLGLEQRQQLASQFGRRGGPWAGLDADQRHLLSAHLMASGSGRVGIHFQVRLDETAKSIDRFLSADGVEKLVLRGVYSVRGDILVIGEGQPMAERPTARQVEAGQDYTVWTLVRETDR